MSTHLGPVDAVEWVVEEFQARTGTRVPLNLPPGSRFAGIVLTVFGGRPASRLSTAARQI